MTVMISTIVFCLGVPCWRWYVAMAMRASGSVTALYAQIFHSTRLAVSFTSVAVVGLFMALALSLGGWLHSHSRKVSSAAQQAQAAIKQVAQGVAT